MKKIRQTYGLFTAIAMIAGIVIGSGIFFKADDILIATGGDIKLGMLVLCIGAFGIIFGSLSLSEFAFRTTRSGGFVGYFEEFIDKKIASGFGLFQTFIYYPSVTVVVSWASIIYLSIAFNWNFSLEKQILLSYVFTVFIIFLNSVSREAGGYIQNISMVIKLLPLFLIAIIGIFYTGSSPQIPADVNIIKPSPVGIAWLGALAPIAFSYDGWPIATSITPEVKNPKITMPRALVIAPILILISYLLYFYGFTKMLGPSFIMSMRDNSLNYAANLIFGQFGAKIMIIFVTIAIMGVVNGIVLGGIRMPQALSEKGILFNKDVSKIHSVYQISFRSSFWYFVICTVWTIIHYFTQKYRILGDRDVSEIAIVFSYFTYILFYVKIMKMYFNREVNSIFRGLISPIFASIGSIIILVGGIISSPLYVSLYLIICISVFSIGYKLMDAKKTLN